MMNAKQTELAKQWQERRKTYFNPITLEFVRARKAFIAGEITSEEWLKSRAVYEASKPVYEAEFEAFHAAMLEAEIEPSVQLGKIKWQPMAA